MSTFAWLGDVPVPCREPAVKPLFFSERADDVRRAIRICNDTCPVREECLSYANANKEQYGVWGGEFFGYVREYKPRPIAKCGTESGVNRHKDRGEPVCSACRAARAQADRVRRLRREVAA